jgi:sulfur carrier protein
MQIKVSSTATEVPDACSVLDLVQGKKLAPGAVIVGVNGVIIKRDYWASSCLNPGDNVEIFRFIGGG